MHDHRTRANSNSRGDLCTKQNLQSNIYTIQKLKTPDSRKHSAPIRNSDRPIRNQDSLRIVLVCNEYPPQPHGGIGTFVHCLAHGLADAGQSITVVGFGEIKRQFNDGDVRVVSLTGSKMRFVGNLISRMRLRAWLISQSKAGQVDLVETPEYMGMLPFGAGNCLVVVRLHLADTLIRSASIFTIRRRQHR